MAGNPAVYIFFKIKVVAAVSFPRLTVTKAFFAILWEKSASFNEAYMIKVLKKWANVK